MKRSYNALACLVGMFAAAGAFAGDLNPPAGPVGATMKPLSQVEPRIAISAATTPGDPDSLFKITQRGSYYLVGNVTGAPGMHGIEIAANDVTIDLCGMSLTGVPGTLSGIWTTNSENVRITNGMIRGWGISAVYLNGKGADISDLCVSNNSGGGIRVDANAMVRNCVAHNNTGAGIDVGGPASIVRDCTSYDNSGHGIAAASSIQIQNCAATENGVTGINAAAIATIIGCTTVQNSGYGILATTASTIRECTVVGNSYDGIVVTADCRVADNLCSTNGITGFGAGVHVLGANNRIEGNTVRANDVGIGVAVAGNFIARNTATDNFPNFSITGVQTIGPIISATGTIASNSPWANFEY